jgi:transposase
MPWEVQPVSELRLAFVHQVVTLHSSVTEACAKFGVSRKTGYKWLGRYRREPQEPLLNQSRRPHGSPERTDETIEQKVLEVRQQLHWGARKIHAYLSRQGVCVPSSRTVNNILRRRGLIAPKTTTDPIHYFERPAANELWQCDHKGPLEIDRRKVHPFTVIDDHSRFLLVVRTCLDLTMKTCFQVLWDTFGEFGLPQSILCDNAFGTTFQVPKTISWFDAQLIRLDIQPIHGRPYHPQTQGKVERLHGTFEQEVWPYVRRDSIDHFDADINRWRQEVYNTIRPHEALGDQPPLSRYSPSLRKRPARIPEVEYPVGAVVRKVHSSGDVRWRGYRILAGRGLVGQWVRIDDRGHEVVIYYGWKPIRCLAHDHLQGDTML